MKVYMCIPYNERRRIWYTNQYRIAAQHSFLSLISQVSLAVFRGAEG